MAAYSKCFLVALIITSFGCKGSLKINNRKAPEGVEGPGDLPPRYPYQLLLESPRGIKPRITGETMKRIKHTEEQIIRVLKRFEAGEKAADLARESGITLETFYNWKAKYGAWRSLRPESLKPWKKRIVA